MSAYLNLIEGTKQLAEERLEREANIKNEREKAEREMKEQQAQAETTGAEEDVPAFEFAFPEGMSDKDKLLLMTSAITNLTNTFKGENK